jgi:hypothetical protein
MITPKQRIILVQIEGSTITMVRQGKKKFELVEKKNFCILKRMKCTKKK